MLRETPRDLQRLLDLLEAEVETHHGAVAKHHDVAARVVAWHRRWVQSGQDDDERVAALNA